MTFKHFLHRLGDRAFVAAELARLRAKYGRRLRRTDRQVVSLEPTGERRGRVLLSYIIDPFLLPAGVPLPHSHTHFWECWTMGRSLLEAGLAVDAISWTHHGFVATRRYDAIIDVRMNLERLAPDQPQAIKVLHADTAHWGYHNPAQAKRHRDLEARRGARIRPQKRLPESRAAEVADLVTILGNDFTRETYAASGKAIHRLAISVPFTYDWPQDKDWQSAGRRFLWFGSGGMVHKGLDLVLEAFAAMPELHLTVCGPVRREADFEAAYFRELYETPNIETIGWVDVAPGGRFESIAQQTGALIYPSCSEGGGSSVLTCMHAAMVAIVPHQASVDIADGETGLLLADCSIETLKDAAKRFAARPATEIESMARAGFRFARQRHTKEAFRADYRRFAAELADRIDSRSDG